MGKHSLIFTIGVIFLFFISTPVIHPAEPPQTTFLRPYVVPPSQPPENSSKDLSGTKERIKSYIKAQFGDDWGKIWAIINCESGFDKDVVNWGDVELNGHPSVGLMQISTLHGYSVEELKDWKTNIDAGKELYDENGLIPWRRCGGKLDLI